MWSCFIFIDAPSTLEASVFLVVSLSLPKGSLQVAAVSTVLTSLSPASFTEPGTQQGHKSQSLKELMPAEP